MLCVFLLFQVAWSAAASARGSKFSSPPAFLVHGKFYTADTTLTVAGVCEGDLVEAQWNVWHV